MQIVKQIEYPDTFTDQHVIEFCFENLNEELR